MIELGVAACRLGVNRANLTVRRWLDIAGFTAPQPAHTLKAG